MAQAGYRTQAPLVAAQAGRPGKQETGSYKDDIQILLKGMVPKITLGP